MIRNYFKIAWRSLVKRKGFTFINITGLAMGFGCSILIFLFVSHHLQFDNFHTDTDRMYRFVTEEHRDFIDYEASVPPGFANAFKEDYGYTEEIAKIVSWDEEIVTVEESNFRQRIDEGIHFTEPSLFKIFNFPLINGSREVHISDPNTAVITERMAYQIFGTKNPVNRTFELGNKELITITGVLKDLPKNSIIQGDIFVSYPTLKAYNEFLSGEFWGGISSNLQCYGLLHPNQNIAEIEENIQSYPAKFRPKSKNVHHYKLQPVSEIHFNSEYSGGINVKVLWIFSLIGFFILFMACVNFINISTGQSVYRSKEVGIRKVLGSFRSQLFWQFMTETFLISSFALVIGFLLSAMSLPTFNTIFDLELSLSSLLTLPFALFISGLLLVITLLSGSYPGVLLVRIAPILALKRKLSQKDAGGFLTRKVLVTSQFAIAIALIIGTIVMNKQLRYALDSDLGFDKSAMLMVELPDQLEPTRLKGLKERISKISGVEKISSCFTSPGGSDTAWGTNVRYDNRPEDEEFSIQVKIADQDYVNTFGLQLLSGRNFYERDSLDEIIVNEAFAKKMGIRDTDELLGKTIAVNGGTIKATIVGVIANFHNQDFSGDISPIFIGPRPSNYREFAIKINLNASGNLIQSIEEEWSSVFPDFIFGYDFLDERVAELYQSEQQYLSLAKLFSILAIIIGCLGIYGLISFFITQKMKEIGIRKVLGSTVGSILMLLTADFLKLIFIAGIIASPLAWYFMNNWLEAFAYHIEISWWVFGLAIGSVLLITFITMGYQTLKAANANPIKSLRTE